MDDLRDNPKRGRNGGKEDDDDQGWPEAANKESL